MNVLSVAAFLLISLALVQSITLVIKKNRRFNNPPFCYAYTREYNTNDVTTSCSGYEYDCIEVQSTVQVGEPVKYDNSVCPTTSAFREFADKDFNKRLAEVSKDHTED